MAETININIIPVLLNSIIRNKLLGSKSLNMILYNTIYIVLYWTDTTDSSVNNDDLSTHRQPKLKMLGVICFFVVFT